MQNNQSKSTANQPKVLITRFFPGDAVESLKERCEVDFRRQLFPMEREELLAAMRGADAVISAGDRFDREMIESAPNLKIIADMWGGRGADAEACRARGVRVKGSGYTIQWISTTEAEHAVMQMLAVARRLFAEDAFVRGGQYQNYEQCNKLFLGQGLFGRKLGIVGGAARAGEDLARRARAFGMDVRYWDEIEGVGYAALGVPRIGFDTLIEESDFIVLMANGCKGYLFDKAQFDRMNHDAILCNVTSGSLINEAELVRALRDGRLRGAGLDKYEREPAVTPGLAELPNVVLTPHSDGALFDVRSAIFKILADACLEALGLIPAQ